ncbi:hypothetical protein A9Q94_02555 [Rhodobacterales bacterium 56_14_T64]|nr:hypothetical protein A9Q94_02555 [Rhodobacterales bacterium 56_14_T64]
MFAKHSIENELQDVTYKQSAWATARVTGRWGTEMEVSLRTYLYEEFSKARSWLDLRRRLVSKGFYLKQVDDRVRLRDAYSNVDICSCRRLGFPSAELTTKFADIRAATTS